MKRLHLGCGKHPKPMYINVDKYQMPGVDVVCDLEKIPWTATDKSGNEIFADESADEIVGIDIIEHVVNAVGFMNECARILKPGGILNLRTCYYLSKNAFTDLDHKHFPTDESFDYWCKGTYFNQEYSHYTEGRLFEKIKVAPVNGELEVVLRRV